MTVMVIQDTPVNVPLVMLGQTVKKTLMNVTQIPAKTERHAPKRLTVLFQPLVCIIANVWLDLKDMRVILKFRVTRIPAKTVQRVQKSLSQIQRQRTLLSDTKTLVRPYGDGYRGLTADECENVPNTVSMTLYGDGLGNHTYGACAYNGMGGTMLGVIDDSQPDLCFFVNLCLP